MKEIYIDFIIVANMLQAKSRKDDITSWTHYCNDMEFITLIEKLGKQIHKNYNEIDKEFMEKYDCDVIYLQWILGRMQSYVYQAMYKEQELFSNTVDNDEDREPLPNECLLDKLESLIAELDFLV